MLPILLLTLVQTGERPPAPDPAALSARLTALAATHPERVERFVYGRSADGVELELVRIGGPPTEPARPGLLLVAGLDPDHPYEPWLAAELAERTAAAADDGAAPLLATYTVYVLPLADPDGLTRAANGGSPGHGPDRDDDRDGRRGEDPPTDVDGDGWITRLRVPDPDGDWIADPHDPRASLERRTVAERLVDAPELAALLAPEVPRWRLEPEGRDADGDGHAGEDPRGDRRFDANFPAGWPEHEPRAGRWATGDPAVRALCDWVLATEDLSVVVALGAVDHLREARKVAGRGEGRVPATGPTEDDLPWLAALAERARAATGIAKGGGEAFDDAGHFLRWAYDHRGLWTLGVRPWVLPTAADAPAGGEGGAPTTEGAETGADGTAADGPETPESPEVAAAPAAADDGATAEGAETTAEDGPPGEPSDDAGRLAWIDAAGETWRFVDWTDLDHPELGPVQVGGFAPGARTVPPAADRAALADGLEAFLFGLGDTAPRLAIERCEAERLSDGLWRIEVHAVNRGWLPSSSSARDRSREGRPAALTLVAPEGASLLSGRARVTLPALDGGAGAEAEWLVRVDDPARLSVELDSPQAGRDSATPTVKEAR